MESFTDTVRNTVKAIPIGEVRTYTEIAILAGSPKAARAVANIMTRNFDAVVPCHRVIRSDGSLGGYNRGGEQKKRAILESEGVKLNHYGRSTKRVTKTAKK
jgi:O-6-methylguanine DNA methyltransferase